MANLKLIFYKFKTYFIKTTTEKEIIPLSYLICYFTFPDSSTRLIF
jgi:hypothetical protein